MKVKIFVCFFIPMLLFSLSLSNTKAASAPLLSLRTDQSIYRLQYNTPSTVLLASNLTLNGAPISNDLVGVTVFQGTWGHYVRPILFRTLATNMAPSQNSSVQLSVTVMGLSGIRYFPKTNFTCPSSSADPGPAFNITFTNKVWLSEIDLTLTIFDAQREPITAIDVMNITQQMPPNSTYTIIVPPTYLQSWVALGNATVYVSAFDKVQPYPYWYFPYCPEASAQFTIKSSSGSQTVSQGETNNSPSVNPLSIEGNYNLTFSINYNQALPSISPWGNYTAEVYSIYQNQLLYSIRTFWVKVPGDFNGDGICNSKDFAFIAMAWLQHVPPGYPADYFGTGYIDSHDAAILAAYWLGKEQPLP